MSLHDDFEQLFSELWRTPHFSGLRRGFRPQVDTYRTHDPAELTIVVDLAGVDPRDVEIVVLDRTLVITGQRRRALPECRLSYYQMEIEYGPFERRVALPEEVDASGARAACERGLLTIVLPIAAQAPRAEKVSIRVRTAR